MDGDAFDYLVEIEIEEEKHDSETLGELEKKSWRTKEGKDILVRKMSSEYIRNCIDMIERNKSWRKHWIPVFEEVLRIREKYEVKR